MFSNRFRGLQYRISSLYILQAIFCRSKNYLVTAADRTPNLNQGTLW